jgi:diguanylate cyclase (GGDEF)-like protein
MSLHPPTLLAAAFAALAMGVVAMVLFGATHRVYRGFWWWCAAQAMFLAGLGLQSGLPESAWALRASELLMLQWPVVLLIGMRRFHARSGLRGSAAHDAIVFALAVVVWLALWAARAAPAWQAVGFALAAASLHAYAVALQLPLVAARRGAALGALLALQALTAAAFGARALQAAFQLDLAVPAHDAALGAGLVGTITALATAWLALLLTHERTEANLTATHRKLRYLADIDVLTRIPNRRHFHELAERWLGLGEPAGAALMMFDIDHFKRINDLLGHAIGDEAIRQVSHCIRESLREPDIAGRLGGDEFAVLLPATSVTDAVGVAQRITIRLQDRQVAPRTAPLSLSFGVVALNPGEGLAEALRRADQALYEAKRQGRQRAVVAQGPEAEPVFTESRALGLAAQ